MKSIEDIQSAYSKAVSALVPAGYRAEVALLDGNGRKKRKDAAAHNWDPLSGSVSITLKPEVSASQPEKAKSISNSQGKQSVAALPTQLAEAVQALDAAEHKVSFVALKWFRDQFLPGFGVAWAATPYAGQETVKEAIDRGLFLTSKVQNPKAPAYPVTAIRLNRDLLEVRQTLGSAPVAHSRIFRPVAIAGEALSDTIVRDRR
ncbi:MAG TPA: hypothetical protein VG322_13965 [Candidatus Acidoferrales bacterium]|jgi:hypothetical protein|nr:hypothetical protein [Candidatus Acidoferrales bacterium]